MKYNKNLQDGHKDDILHVQETIKIYLQKDEQILEKYGDEEAALYEQMVQMEQ